MDTNFNLKGHVQIYNGLGECVFDEHNDITDLGKTCILGKMANDSDIPNIAIMWYSYGTNNMNISVSANKLIADAEYDAKDNFYTEFFGNGYWDDSDGIFKKPEGSTTNNNAGLLSASITSRATVNTDGSKTEYTIYYDNDSNPDNGLVTIKFTDTSDSVSVEIEDDDKTSAPNAPSSYGCFTYGANNKSLIYYTYIKTGGSSTPNFTGISLGTINDIRTVATLGISSKYCIIPYTGLSFDLGALVANSTYVIKYTLYM